MSKKLCAFYKIVVNTPAGKMKVEMKFSKIKVNKGISDKEFKIE